MWNFHLRIGSRPVVHLLSNATILGYGDYGFSKSIASEGNYLSRVNHTVSSYSPLHTRQEHLRSKGWVICADHLPLDDLGRRINQNPVSSHRYQGPFSAAGKWGRAVCLRLSASQCIIRPFTPDPKLAIGGDGSGIDAIG